ncbi:MFS transporter [Streptomyces sp. 1331.2]|uniref:MFS transporter n=1 Tax=Streptomyces sp. 1331.2 TaxID=1938835 RepID=UPI000BCB8ECB|nr:MFS transporter [Streptomyces sp. 1331.2]SOB83369.1 Major Facilitator Superfamily protein [Streptomyces sp. 1331.2]
MPAPALLASYRRLFAAPGAAAFTLAGLLGRLAMPMTGVSLVVLLSERRGSYGLAGTVSAAGLVTGAIGMPLIGRLVDRYGQARVTVPAALYNAVPLAALLLCVRFGAPDWTLYLCNAACAAAPNLGGMARSRWAHLYRDDPAARHLANSFEQALDELCFMTGPVLAMLLCTTLAPEAGLVTAGTLGTTGALLFAAQRRTEPPLPPVPSASPSPAPGRTSGRPHGSPLRVPGLRVLVLTFLATGMVFGATEITTVAYADALGHKAAAGVLLGLVAAGSCVAGLLFGLLTPRRTPGARFLAGVSAMAAVLLLPLAAGLGGAGLVLLGMALFAAGTATAPTMVIGMTLVQELLPQRQFNEGMAMAVSGIVVGISTGAALAGTVAEHAAPGTGYALPASAAALALLIALAGRRHLRTRRRSTAGESAPETAGENPERVVSASV